MKKLALLIVCLNCILIYSQNGDALLSRSESLKSGNQKDLLHTFYQIALKNTSFDENALEFNSTLFAIKSELNPSLKQDVKYVEEKFSRNFQVKFKVNLDDDYNYTGSSAGFTYAIYNGRAKELADLSKTAYGKEFENSRKIIRDIQVTLTREINRRTDWTEEKKNSEIELLEKATEDFLNAKTHDNASNEYYNKITNLFSEKAQENSIAESDIIKYYEYLKKLEEEEFKKIEARSLWTIAGEAMADKDSKFNKASLETVFLKGITGSNFELDIRAGLTYTDSIPEQNISETLFTSKAGLNWKAVRNAKDESIVEIKGYGEYQNVLDSKYKSTLKSTLTEEGKKDKFVANLDLRIRITDDLWIPFTIKYDPEEGNVFGFLNITYNFEPLSN